LIFGEEFFKYYCENCGNKYVDEVRKICNQCQFKNNFTNWSSGNKKIDNFIQEKQLKFDGYSAVFEWIPFNELIIIKEIEDSYSAIAILKNGSLHYNYSWIREPYEKVCLKYLHNSQDITDKFLTEVLEFSSNLD
jgi:hypothetical protein